MSSSGVDHPSIVQARRLVHDLLRPNPLIFWLDFLVSLTLGYTTAMLYVYVDEPGWLRLVTLPMAACALYRTSLFMHEIVHFRRGEMRGFTVAWNMLAGVFMLTPSFFYQSHHAHHNTHLYGTRDDGEYLPLGRGPWRMVWLFLSQVFFQPLLVFARFLLAPLSFIHPRLRRWTLEHVSSFVIRFPHRREVSARAPRRWWAAMDLACSARAWAIPGLVLAGYAPWTEIPLLYSLAVSILALNYLRTLTAHHYLNAGRRMTHEEQLLDSTVITGGWLTELLCPVGLRYHALHHLFPSMPYHNLGIAHHRLMQELPLDAPYRRVVYPTVWSVMRTLAQHIREARARPESPCASRSPNRPSHVG